MSQVTINKNSAAKKNTPPPAPVKAAPQPAAAAPSRAQKAAATRKANNAAKLTEGTTAKVTKAAKATPQAAEVEVTTGGRVGRKELAATIYDALKEAGTPVPQRILESAVAAYESAVASALSNGSEVQLPGFGKFVVTAKEARTGRNPKTGDAVDIAAYNAVRFKVGAKLKAAVNGGNETEGEDEATGE